MADHPDLVTEQAHLDAAYEALEASRKSATRLKGMVEVGKGGTNQARWEREVMYENIAHRLSELHVGDASLVFGRIDRDEEHGDDRFHIGRIAVSDSTQEPLVVDWRAPVAEPFYRATGREPMGLARRRHFATRGRTLLAIEDELFDENAYLGAAEGAGDEDDALVGKAALIASLEEARTGRLGDIVATIQSEQDEIIRSDLATMLVVQGGPGTGKTVVALHRAAYLLYTHRFPLEGQGVLVVGPNRLFLGYIEYVLPSLGEVGVDLAVTSDLVDGVRVDGNDEPEIARTKGDARMAEVLEQALADRQRPLRDDIVVPFGAHRLRFSAAQSAGLVRRAQRRFRHHNQARRFIEQGFFAGLAASPREAVDPAQVREATRELEVVRASLDWMWPTLTPAHALHDLMGSQALLRSAGRCWDPEAVVALHRPRAAHASRVVWTHEDAPLLDELHALLGSVPDIEDIRTFGHIVVDEAQDRSPMELRMLARRSLGGSMTVVGDMGQSTGAWGQDDWHDVLAHLPEKRAVHMTELTVGYRIPETLMAPGNAVLAEATPGLTPPTAVRHGGELPRYVTAASAGRLAETVIREARASADVVAPGHIAVIVPRSLVEPIGAAFDTAGLDFGRATRRGLDAEVTVVPVDKMKGLELDAVVVVEPAAIVEEEQRGLRALYVALTRATQRLTIVHSRDLPAPLAAVVPEVT